MTEREKIIVTIQNRIDEARNKGLKTTTIFISTLSKCMALLKENEPQQAELRNATWYCPRCKNPVTMFDYGEFNKYCGFCGQKVIF